MYRRHPAGCRVSILLTLFRVFCAFWRLQFPLPDQRPDIRRPDRRFRNDPPVLIYQNRRGRTEHPEFLGRFITRHPIPASSRAPDSRCASTSPSEKTSSSGSPADFSFSHAFSSSIMFAQCGQVVLQNVTSVFFPRRSPADISLPSRSFSENSGISSPIMGSRSGAAPLPLAI